MSLAIEPCIPAGSLSGARQPANASGSRYALWRVDDRAELATLPVVVFGDEGGIGLVARNLRELFQQLGCDRALHVGDYSAWFDDETDDETDDEADDDSDDEADDDSDDDGGDRDGDREGDRDREGHSDRGGDGDAGSGIRGNGEYLAWLKEHFGLAAAPDPDALAAAAEEEFAERFVNGFGRFVDDEDFVDDFMDEPAGNS
ncbi:hypothetical protein [Streptomyces noursei]|uniref:hypothetical protein n=1 Tax=Streptomyces noursei TaxID=1971 RepID=UPI00167206AB|nr:hypothetical protein [Streptomyces noursei]MCZ1013123.1 hypothetical protein [Streptomyces noursei]